METTAIQSLNKLFLKNSNASQATAMSKYMKNHFPFHGIQKPTRSKLQKIWIAEFDLLEKSSGLDHEFIKTLWEQPEREYQYVALDLILAWKPKIQLSDLDLCKFLIENKSRWDTVDVLSSHFLGTIIQKFPTVLETDVINWSSLGYIRQENLTLNKSLWLKRSSIICQLRMKESTNTDLLEKIILENCNTDEFFLNKAIGWALREYSKSNKNWVKSFIKKNKEQLSTLSIREGSKYV